MHEDLPTAKQTRQLSDAAFTRIAVSTINDAAKKGGYAAHVLTPENEATRKALLSLLTTLGYRVEYNEGAAFALISWKDA